MTNQNYAILTFRNNVLNSQVQLLNDRFQIMVNENTDQLFTVLHHIDFNISCGTKTVCLAIRHKLSSGTSVHEHLIISVHFN